MTTIKDLAAASGLSKSTVSRVVNNAPNVKPETRERVMRAIEKLDYRPDILARGMVTGTLPMVLVIVGDIQNHFFTQSLAGIKETLQKKDFMVVVFDNGYDDRREAEAIQKAKICHFAGIIPMTGFSSELVNQELREAGCPVVLLNCHRESGQFDRVCGDDYRAGFCATQALIKRGYRKIYHFSGNSAASHISAERERGYTEAMQEAELSVTSGMILQGDLRQAGGYALAKQCLKGTGEPAAICCNNFLMCLGVMNYAEERGLVPQRDFGLAICEQPPSFYEKTNFIYAGPRLQDMGKTAAELLLDRIHNPAVERRTEILSSLEIHAP